MLRTCSNNVRSICFCFSHIYFRAVAIFYRCFHTDAKDVSPKIFCCRGSRYLFASISSPDWDFSQYFQANFCLLGESEALSSRFYIFFHIIVYSHYGDIQSVDRLVKSPARITCARRSQNISLFYYRTISNRVLEGDNDILPEYMEVWVCIGNKSFTPLAVQ